MNDNLRTVLDHEIERSVSWASSTIREDQARNLQYYLGLPLGNEVEGRSQARSWDTFEIIESALPSFLEPIFGGDNIAEFQPRGPEDEQSAQQATDYVNYLVTERNDGFMVFYTWIKDALLQKVGIVRPEWIKQDPERQEYEGLTEEQVTLLTNDPKNEIKEGGSARLVEMVGPDGKPVQVPVYDLTVMVSRPGQLKIRNVKPTEFVISRDARTPDEAFVIGEIVTYTRSELKEMGHKRWRDVASYDVHSIGMDSLDPDDYENDYNRDDAASPELEEVQLFKGFVRCDCNGDGIAEWREVLVGGGPDDTLQDDEVEGQDYAVITPIPIPHRVIGMAYADSAADIEKLSTGFIRQYVDSVFLATNPRTYVNMAAQVNLEDLLNNRIGGLVRGNGPASDAVAPLQTTLVARDALEGFQLSSNMRETRLGITKYNQGLDSDSLNKTATGIGKIMQASEQRLKTTLRIMANTGFKRFFQIVLRLVTQHQDVADVVRLRNEWVSFNPSEWSDGMDCKIQIGGTNGERMEEIQMLQLFGQFMQLAAPLGVTTPQNVYEFGKKLAKSAKIMGADTKLLTDPSQQPPKQPPPDPAMVKAQADMQAKQAELQMKQQATQADLQFKQQSSQIDMETARVELQIKLAELEIKRQELTLKAQSAQMDQQIRAQSAAMQASDDMARAQEIGNDA